jgi:hypothetical protein
MPTLYWQIHQKPRESILTEVVSSLQEAFTACLIPAPSLGLGTSWWSFTLLYARSVHFQMPLKETSPPSQKVTPLRSVAWSPHSKATSDALN